MDDFSSEALTADDRRRGGVLTCRMRPEGVCVLDLDYPAARARLRPASSIAASFGGLEWLTSNVVRLWIHSPTGLDFLPGQYATLTIPGTSVRRSYSYATKPGGTEAAFIVRLLTSGAMSDWLRSEPVAGAPITLHGPFGRFFLRDPTKPLLFVAGGTGLGPILSILSSPRPIHRDWGPVEVVFGIASGQDAFCIDEMAALTRNIPGLVITLIAVAPAADWPGSRGTPVDLLENRQVDPGTHVYLCGPPGMVAAARVCLARKGVPDSHVFFESFLPAGTPGMPTTGAH